LLYPAELRKHFIIISNGESSNNNNNLFQKFLIDKLDLISIILYIYITMD